MDQIRETLKEIDNQGLMRSVSSRAAAIDFSSNDYLGLAHDPQVRAQMIQALASGIPLGATGSRLLRGTSVQHEQTEDYLSKTFAMGSALLFGSGYAANVGLLSTLGGTDTVIFSDELNHASIIDGIRLSRGRYHVYRHGDLNHLEELMAKESRTSRRIIVTETIFSMDGDTPDLKGLAELAKRFDAWLIADETHATGVFGTGLVPRCPEMKGVRLAAVHAAGKALGAFGAFTTGPQELKQLLVNRARSFVFSTAIAPLNALQIRLAMQATLTRPKLSRQCLSNADYLRDLLGGPKGTSQIIPVLVPGNENVTRAATRLQDLGFDVRGIRSPTVKPGTERLRIAVKSQHSPQELERLARAIKETVKGGQ
jgi:8-amino-7-oxononanoate synthase